MQYLYLSIFWTLYLILHSVLAGNGMKGYVKLKFPSFYPFYRIAYNLIATLLLLPLMYHQYTIPKQLLFEVDLLLKIVGYGLVLIGAVLGKMAFKNYSTSEFFGLDFNKKTSEKKNILMISGFNKGVRHPVYSASYLLAWGYFIANPDLTIFIIAILISLYLVVGTKFEERKLIEEFGDQYVQYVKTVPMLFPWKIFK